MLKTPFALAAALLWLAAPAFADDDGEENDWRRSGWYLSLNGSHNFQDIGHTMGARVYDSFGAGIRAGWRFQKYFAGELEFQWVNSFEFKDAPFEGLDYWLWTFGLNGRAYLPFPRDPDSFWNRTQPYLMAGFGLQQTDPRGRAVYPPSGAAFDSYETSGSFYGKVGGGVELFLTHHWGLGLEANYTMAVSETSLGNRINYVGVLWNFLYRF